MIIETLSGLGMFLFGMLYMEQALKEVAGVRFKNWIRSSTSTTAKSLITGATSTAILQSSSLVTLMTLSFVSAGLMSLYSGIAVIFGSNLGTTVTAWIVATVGFKIKIELFSLPMIGLGGFLLVLGLKNRKIAAFAKLLIGFGLLFFGLQIMKEALTSTAQTLDLSLFKESSKYVFVLIGFILTALIQSSSAAMAIVLTSLYAGILSFEQSTAMVIGTNIGTTVTALLGAIGGIPDKKRAAAAHFVFNLFTAVVALLMLPLLTHLILETFSMQKDPVVALAIFHTLFNLIGVILLTPFIGLLASWLNKHFLHKQEVPTHYIHLVDPKIPDTAFVALRNEVSYLFVKTMKFALLIANIKPSDIIKKKIDIKDLTITNQYRIPFDYESAYEVLKDIEIDILEFIAILTQSNLSKEQGESIELLLMSVRESVYAAKILKDVKENIDTFTESENVMIIHTFEAIRRNLAYMMNIFINYINETWDQDKCLNKFQKGKEENQMILRKATANVGQKGVNEKVVASLLNTNRSVFNASESLMNASKATMIHYAIDIEEEEG